MSFLSFFKYVLFVYNFIVMLFGGSLLAAAIYFYIDTLQYIGQTERAWPIYSKSFILIIGLGLLTFIVGFFGCCGAVKESSCMLCLYFTIIVAICGIIAALIFLPDKFGLEPQHIKQQLQHDLKNITQHSYSRYNTSSVANMVIDKIQEDFQCCGSVNYKDWEYSLQNNSTRPNVGVGSAMSSYIVAIPSQQSYNLPRQLGSAQPQTSNDQYQQHLHASTTTTSWRVPVSCCSKLESKNLNSYSQCRSTILRSDANPSDQQYSVPNVNQEGCVDKIYNYLFITHWWPMCIIGGISIGLQGLSLIFSLCLCCAINRAYDEYDDEDEKRI